MMLQETVHPVVQRADERANAQDEAFVPRPDPGEPKPKRKRKKKKLKSQAMNLTRRVHLYSGLFMLPWVLLYGFTALLFNHPTVMSGSNTSIQSIALTEAKLKLLPSAAAIAEAAVESANKKLESDGSRQTVQLVDPDSAVFTRQVSGSVENRDQNVAVILDLNTGKGYLRKKQKPDEVQTENDTGEDKRISLNDGLQLGLENDPVTSFKNGVSELLVQTGHDPEKLNVRGIPTIEFDALVDGKRMRLRFAPQQRGRRGDGPTSKTKPIRSIDTRDQPSAAPIFNGKLSIVGAHPRVMSARSFLLRLHMASGYPVQANARWFWAIAVDLMFASMVFWGFSGVFMWWQIKRTRKIGFVILLMSAVAATWLAIGMHLQLTNG